MSSPSTTVRRKPPHERRAEILRTAGAIAVDEGLESVTARRVAEALSVYPGLISHYFATADELVAAAFEHAAVEERDELFALAAQHDGPLAQLRALLQEWLAPSRDAVSLLWLDAWQSSRRRPAVRAAVTAQMQIDLERLAALIETGRASGDFELDDSRVAATRILALVDGSSVQAAIRTSIDYTPVADMVLATAELTVGVRPGALLGA